MGTAKNGDQSNNANTANGGGASTKTKTEEPD